MIQGTGSECRQIDAGRGAVSRVSPARAVGRAVQAAEHVEQRRRHRRWRRDRPRAGVAGAWPAGVEPRVDMNPVLLKPETDAGAQVIVQGQRWQTLRAQGLRAREADADAAGSGKFRAAEGTRMIWCWSKARAALPRSICAAATSPIWALPKPRDVPVVLVGDIDRGGVIAQMVGTACGARSRATAPGSRASHQQVPRRCRRCSTTAVG